MRYAANVSLLFAEEDFLDRFERATAAGLSAVEFWWPPANPSDVIAAVGHAGLEVAVLNFDAGNMAAGDRGLLSDPARQAGFRANVPVALALAAAVGCMRLNALVGLALPGFERARQIDLAVRNVQWAADRAAPQGAEVLIEPLNLFENGPYLLGGTSEGLTFLDRVGRDNVRLQYDAYHMQRMEGNIVDTLRRHIGRIGHVQIADSPGRGQPGTGEINYDYVLGELEALGYDGYVGMEYRPTGTTEDSLRWLRNRQSPAPAEAAR